MRRHDRELTEKQELMRILDEADVCRLAIRGEEYPYIVPLNFGYSWDNRLILYFHSAPVGRKIDLLRRDNRVGFEIDTGHELQTADQACGWGMKFKSLIGAGEILFISDEQEKEFALLRILRKYGYEGQGLFDRGAFAATVTYKLLVERVTGKQKK